MHLNQLQIYISNVTWTHIFNIIFYMYNLEYKNFSIHFFLNTIHQNLCLCRFAQFLLDKWPFYKKNNIFSLSVVL